MNPVGVVHGRFQVLHNDHMQYILAGKARCRHLVIGITNPDPTLTKDDSSDPHRSRPAANPLTYFERYRLVIEALHESGVNSRDLSVVPLPINLPELCWYYVPFDAVFYLTIYDEWGLRKLELMRSLGLETEVMWTRSPGEKGLTGTEVRRRIKDGLEWAHLVPASTARLMKIWGIPQRLSHMAPDHQLT